MHYFKNLTARIIVALSILMIIAILAPAPTLSTAEANTGGTSGLATHRVAKGESLFLISRQYGITVDQLRRANNLRTDEILVGQVLTLPTGARKDQSGTPATHRVAKGESLFLISRQYGITVDQLRRANNLRTDEILVGQVLTLPAGAQKALPSQTASRGTAASRFTENDVYWLAKIIHAEARGEVYEGQVAVGAVILNRVRSTLFPNTIYGVIFEVTDGRYYQFSPALDGSINLEPNQTAYRASRDAINGWDPSGGALYFYNPQTSTNRWIFSRPIIKRIGKHVFAL